MLNDIESKVESIFDVKGRCDGKVNTTYRISQAHAGLFSGLHMLKKSLGC